MDAVVLCGGKATRLNAFSCIDVNKVKIFEQKLKDQLRTLGVHNIYFLGWDYQNDEEKDRLNTANIYYKNYPEMDGSYKELSALIKDTDLMPPFLLLYGDVLQNYRDMPLQRGDDINDLLKKYKTLILLGYEVVMHVTNVLFDYEDGNISIHNTKPMVMKYDIKNSSWIDAGMFFVNKIDTERDVKNWQDYLKDVVKKGKVGYILVNRPYELNTPYSVYRSPFGIEHDYKSY